jgi:Tol biopolymer transport system component
VRFLAPLRRSVLLAAALCLGATGLSAQYFGQNKVRYKTFDFQVLRTPHFDVYYYPQEAILAREVGRMAERWYVRFATILKHQLSSRQPIVLYASHPDFEQTNVVPGLIPQTVGGVTVPIGRAVIFPAAGTLADTDHVLGHELVHAFQFDMGPRDMPSSGLEELPLWFVEGMAEYLSVGPKDPQTAMWMRDAALRDALPTLRTLGNTSKYFPYRFGQAFWAYETGRFGDATIGPLLRTAIRRGPDAAIQSVLRIEPRQLSDEWRAAVSARDRPILAATRAQPAGPILVASKPPLRRINVSPALSPDGHWVMFFSERGIFSIDLYLADARTGKVVRKITSSALDPHLGSLEFIRSAGAWSPHGHRFAFARIAGARAELSIYDLAQNRVVRDYTVPGVDEVFSPSWSPDGAEIVFTGIAHGFTNLYLLQTASGSVKPLTDDQFAELQPAWSPDGRQLAFVTDRFTTNLADLAPGAYRIALMDVQTGAVTEFASPLAADETNPQWSPDGKTLYFLSDATGIVNLYRQPLNPAGVTRQLGDIGSASGLPLPGSEARPQPDQREGGTSKRWPSHPEALTNTATGIAGVTPLSPAFSVAQQSGEVVYSQFSQGGYELVRLAPAANATAAAAAVARLDPALLPPRQSATGAVASALANPQAGLVSSAPFTTAPYRPSLRLAYIAPPSIGIGVSPFGTLLGGGTAFVFSDLLNDNTLSVSVESLGADTGGFVRNLSGQAVYLDQSHRWTWGVGGGQSPYLTSAFTAGIANLNGSAVLVNRFLTLWELDRQVVGIVSYPFSRAQRVEFSAGYENIGFAARAEDQYVDPATGILLADLSQDVPAPPALNFAIASGALVYDTSIFGGASPVRGQSYRLQLGMNAGSLDYATTLADYRRYLELARPLALAGRVLEYGRFGSGADDSRLQALFLGYPALVRGYDAESFSAVECGPELQTTGACPVFDRLLGSKLGVVNGEVRLELTGPLGVWMTPRVPPVELAPFFDAGVAWTAADKPGLLGGHRQGVTSEGVTLRGNVLGFLVAAVTLAFPNNRPGVGHVWEFTVLPGY